MAKKDIRAGLYARVSTDDQTCENQLIDLRKVCEQRNWIVVDEYVDRGISGAKGRDVRKQFDRLLKDAGRGRINMAAIWKIDRLGRSTLAVLQTEEELRNAGCDLYSYTEQIDGSTPMGKAMISMCGVFAELERANLIQRVNAGIARAKAAGVVFGRPKLAPDVEKAVRDALTAPGRPGFHKIAAACGVSTGSVQRIAAELNAEAGA
jgi:DNA invertase Pin-like site-specific DNA recombinase